MQLNLIRLEKGYYRLVKGGVKYYEIQQQKNKMNKREDVMKRKQSTEVLWKKNNAV